MMKRSAFALGVPVVALTMGLAAPTAGAASDARLSGAFQVREVVVEHPSNPDDLGTQLERKWKFKPSCASGACDTKLRFKTSDGRVTTPLKRKSSTRYKGRVTYDGRCYAHSDGHVIDEDAYRVTSVVTVIVDEISPSGDALAFHTVRKLKHKRKAGVTHECVKRDFVKLVGTSLN